MTKTETLKKTFNTPKYFKDSVKFNYLPTTSAENQELFNSCVSFANMFYEKNSKIPYKTSTSSYAVMTVFTVFGLAQVVSSMFEFKSDHKTFAALQALGGIAVPAYSYYYFASEQNIHKQNIELKYEQDFCTCVETYLTGEAIDMCNNQPE